MRTKKANLTEQVMIRVTTSERRAIERAADLENRSVSSWIRLRLLELLG